MDFVPLRYYMRHPLGPLDPLQADRADVMPVAKNIYAPLVSIAMGNNPQGMIAEKWSVDSTGKIWRFTIKKNLFFDDGTPITSTIVWENFRRIFWKTKNDNLSLNALLPELSGWENRNVPLKNMVVEKDDIVFKFSKRPTNLFEEISMPIYGIANPKCFDSFSSQKNTSCPSGSGQYKIALREKNKILLQSRHVFQENKAAPEFVEILTPSESEKDVAHYILNNIADLTSQSSFDLSPDEKSKIENGGFNIIYEPAFRMHFIQLNDKKTPFSDKKLRQEIRDSFLWKLFSSNISNQIEIDPSFIPKGGVGYLKFDIKEPSKMEKTDKKIKLLLLPTTENKLNIKDKKRGFVEKILISALGELGFKLDIVRLNGGELIEKRKKGDFDVLLLSSGVSIYDPYNALRMMFMSKIGAEIPDPSKKIPELIIEAENADVPIKRKKLAEKINETIYDEAAVITYAHSGYVYIHSKNVGLSELNLFSDPIEFRCVSWDQKK